MGYDKDRGQAPQTSSEEILERERAAAGGGTKAAEDTVSPEELQQQESAPSEPFDADQVGRGYTEAGKKGKRTITARGWGKRGAIGGVLAGGGLLGGLGLFSITLGPLHFVHISQMLQDFNFSAQDDTDDDRLLAIYRFVRYGQSQAERTRLGFLANRMADRFEARMQAAGMTSLYTPAFGLFDGYEVDRRHPNFRNLNDQQIIKLLQDEGLPVVRGRDITDNPALRNSNKIIIDGRNQNIGYWKNKRFMKKRMVEAGAYKVSASTGSNLLKIRQRATLHPLKRLDEKYLRKVEDLYHQIRERRKAKIARGSPAVPTTNLDQREDAPDQEKQNAGEAKEGADKILAEGQQAAQTGDPKSMLTFENSLKAIGVTGAAGGIVSLPCILRAINAQAADYVKTGVTDPATRMGMEFTALAGHVQGGGDDTQEEQLGYYDSILTGKDSTGQVTTATDARTFQAMSGVPQSGPDANETLKAMGGDLPFQRFSEGGLGATFDTICSGEVQGVIAVAGFIGGPVTAAAQTAALALVQGPLISQAARWAAAQPLDVINAAGREAGYIITYGARWAGLQQNLASGGAPMSLQEENRMREFTTTSARAEFEEKSLAYRLFNPYDYRTPVAKLIDSNGSNSITKNLASLTNSFLNITGSLGTTLGNIMTGRSHAAATQYPYPFPTAGFTVQEMTDRQFENPYANGDAAANILDGPEGDTYRERARACFGVTVAKNAQNQWTATSTPDVSPRIQDLNKPECSSQNVEWKKIRFFIKDTTVMAAIACYFGDDQACIDIGVSNGAPPATGGGTPNPVGGGGDAKVLAAQILANKNIKFQKEPLQRQALEQVARTGAQQDCGTSIPISPVLLNVILEASKKYNIVLGAFSIDHGCDGKYHSKGKAVDINGVAQGSVSTGNQLHFDELNGAQRNLVRQFYGDLGNLFPPNTGGMGQIQCDSNLPQRIGVVYFSDPCSHLHIDVRGT